MRCTREAVIAQNRAWLGKKESDGSHKAIIDIYNAHLPRARGYKLKYTDPWCAGYVSAVAIACGGEEIIPLEVGCGKMVTLAKNMGIWVEADDHDPLPGDIVVYYWKAKKTGDQKTGASHVGYIETVKEKKYTVIEGNFSNRVKRRNLKHNDYRIRGYITPQYGESPESAVKEGDTVMLKTGAKTYDGRKLLNFVFKRPHKVKEVAGDRAVITYSGITVAAVKVSDLEVV